LIIDRLFETLDKRILRWHGSWKKRTLRRASGTILTFLKKESNIAKQSNTDEKEGMEEQLSVGKVKCVVIYLLHTTSSSLNRPDSLAKYCSCSPSDFSGIEILALALNHISGLKASQYWF